MIGRHRITKDGAPPERPLEDDLEATYADAMAPGDEIAPAIDGIPVRMPPRSDRDTEQFTAALDMMRSAFSGVVGKLAEGFPAYPAMVTEFESGFTVASEAFTSVAARRDYLEGKRS